MSCYNFVSDIVIIIVIKIGMGLEWFSHESITSRKDAREWVRVNTTWTDVDDDDHDGWRISPRMILRDIIGRYLNIALSNI